MAKRVSKPTESELEILNVLWRRGSCTVRDVFDELGEAKGVGQTTILKLMQIMLEKGLVTRIEQRRPQVYAAAHAAAEVQRLLTGDLLRRAFQGSAHKLVMHALEAGNTSPAELEAIRKLLDKYEGNAS